MRAEHATEVGFAGTISMIWSMSGIHFWDQTTCALRVANGQIRPEIAQSAADPASRTTTKSRWAQAALAEGWPVSG